MKNIGFTVTELLVSIGVIVILGTIGFAAYKSFGGQFELNGESHLLVSTLNRAREKTLSSEDSSNYGVHFESDKYVLFKGAVYDSLDAGNIVRTLPVSLELFNINFSGGSDVIFDRVTGRTDDDGTVIIRMINPTSNFREISVLSSGHAGFIDTVVPIDSRIADTRHVHFELGTWSIQGATTLSLYFSDFPNPDVQVDIPMAGYFDAGPTSFFWEGTTNVNGQNQTIKIHTHFLDAFNTILSVHRDRRYNNKALAISIDGKAIVSYDSDGAATVGGFGGTMSVQ
ncbi:MAG: hypothetical protein HY564_01930 [Candidatus Jacksonbacteria bacterium]|nr:hypothetical protein [Candidatus Jacksonbacteria bacterium]